MQPNDEKNDLLSRLVLIGTMDVVHLPYTPAFKKNYSTLTPSTSTEDKHEIWERVLALQSRSRAENPSAAPPMGGVAVPEQNSPAIPKVNTSTALAGFRTSLFDLEVVLEQQPWTAPKTAPLSLDLQQARDQMLADVAESRLGMTEQRVAYLLQCFRKC